MVLSLAVVLAGVAVFFVFVMPHGDDEPDVAVVEDIEATLSAYARQAPYPASAPAGLPEVFKPTTVRVTLPSGGTSDGDNTRITIGYVVDRPDDRTFARFLQSNAPDAVQAILGDRPITGSVDVAGQTWDERRDSDGHLALTRVDTGGVTSIVDDGGGPGGAEQADLATVAAALRPIDVNAVSGAA
ncbi:hypothetical protein CcI49_23565 [Frankia sp. CcI49]|uniref:DUF4245 domain-containing protein n=2 Tax=Frankiales TaxID=85013 RepID=A0A0S4QUY8_9ACTN|nr:MULTISPECIES: DUF4245 domain-containing protein [Parafrankia]EFC81991.1 hypothetical protein FrEUN1fDRAFT_4872 [Parafrankia sp. EUN1f]KPM57452.1 hypothetical protein ACG83_07125 [Frankia sp. R43]ONH57927.1 hypothetical protein CcI49_23565 [Frankia sp. CcI49]CUU58668.1 Protein of unknown function (DUF4245) [Parafrankia irregularis]